MRFRKKNKKNKNQTNFIFEDVYQSEDFINKPSTQSLVSSERSIFIFFIFLILILIFTIKILLISSQNKNVYNFKENPNKFIKSRGDILDRNGNIIATNVDVFSAGIRSKFVKDKKNFLINLRLKFPKLDIEKIKKNLYTKKFFYIEKKLTPDEYEKLWSIGEKGMVFEKRQYRIYPHKNLFSQVIGQTDYDNRGISGFEKFYDHELKSKDLISSGINLTLDANLQFLIRNELKKSEEYFENIGSGAILMDIKNGEVLSLVSLPDYDLNKRAKISETKYTNKITKGVYELGSVFKTFTLAAGLENKVIEPNTIFKDLENKIYCAGRSISEHDKLPPNLSAEQILVRSSNIGAIRIAQRIGIDEYKNFLESLGLFETIDFELEEIGAPHSFRWGKCKLATASFGHGITTTPLQLAKAYSILTNGGFKINPTIVKKNYDNEKKRIISSITSKQINIMLRKVVSKEEGTANFADIEGYDVGGKTGTALKNEYGKYTKKKLNTFISIFPTKNPEYLLLVILDEPKPAPNFVYTLPNGYKHKGEKRNTSGWNTVVVAGKIIEKIGPILAIKNLQASKNF